METTLSYTLESFEGPLDLLLQLIARNKLNIYDIKLSVLIEQYLEQIEKFKQQEMEIASEFLQMASRLIYMKTVSLLPQHEEVERLKQELTGELIEYKTCREQAEKLSKLTNGFNRFVKKPEPYEAPKTYELIHTPDCLFTAYLSAVGRGQRRLPPPVTPFTKIVAKKIVAVSTKIVYVMRNLLKSGKGKLSHLYSGAKSRSELVATFLAVLELCKANRIEITGNSNDAEIKLIKEHKK